MSPRTDKSSAHFKTMLQTSVPQGRKGKHQKIVAIILNDLDKLQDGSAIKVPLAELVESKEKVRSALNRATRKAGRAVATASDASFLYVWNVSASR
jgi:phosphopantothenoylcysteine synthetase/decarboxylase